MKWGWGGLVGKGGWERETEREKEKAGLKENETSGRVCLNPWSVPRGHMSVGEWLLPPMPQFPYL